MGRPAPKWVWLVLVAILAFCVIGWEMFGPPAKKRAADRALKAALVACQQGGRVEVDRRVVEAKLAFDALDVYDQTIYEAKLDTGLRVWGCK
jgi:hypothetical protein